MSKNITNVNSIGKNNFIQIVRAFAIIAIVMIHTCPPGEWQIICRPFLNFSVATFLFLSGYLTKVENENWYAFYKKRIIRVIVPYIIWTVLYCLPAIIVYKDVMILFKNLITAKAAAPLYYIFVYIQFVILTPWLGKLAKSKFQFLGWLIAPVSVILFKYYSLLSGVEFNSYISLIWSDACLGWFTFYYLGLILGNKIINKDYSLKTLSILYLISIVLQMGEGYGWYLLGENNCGTQIKLTSFLTSSIFLLIIYTMLKNKKFEIKNKVLRLLGDYSFGIYLCHIMVMTCLSIIPFYRTIPFPVNSIIIITISLACCYISNKILGEKFSSWLGLR